MSSRATARWAIGGAPVAAERLGRATCSSMRASNSRTALPVAGLIVASHVRGMPGATAGKYRTWLMSRRGARRAPHCAGQRDPDALRAGRGRPTGGAAARVPRDLVRVAQADPGAGAALFADRPGPARLRRHREARRRLRRQAHNGHRRPCAGVSSRPRADRAGRPRPLGRGSPRASSRTTATSSTGWS